MKKLLLEMEQPLCNVLSDIEIEWFPLNEDVLNKINDEYTTILQDLQNVI